MMIKTYSSLIDPVQLAALAQEPRQVKATVPKPYGQAGKDYSICVEMGLATTADNQKKYKVLLVSYTFDM